MSEVDDVAATLAALRMEAVTRGEMVSELSRKVGGRGALCCGGVQMVRYHPLAAHHTRHISDASGFARCIWLHVKSAAG